MLRLSVPIIIVSFLFSIGMGVYYIFFEFEQKISGDGMEPKYKNTQVFDVTRYILVQPKREDVVVFDAPNEAGYRYVKRIIGLPNETIQIKDGKVYINEIELSEVYLDDKYTSNGDFVKDGTPITLGEDQFFVMGDNRAGSSDSRHWGPIKKENLLGKLTSCHSNCD